MEDEVTVQASLGNLKFGLRKTQESALFLDPEVR